MRCMKSCMKSWFSILLNTSAWGVETQLLERKKNWKKCGSEYIGRRRRKKSTTLIEKRCRFTKRPPIWRQCCVLQAFDSSCCSSSVWELIGISDAEHLGQANSCCWGWTHFEDVVGAPPGVARDVTLMTWLGDENHGIPDDTKTSRNERLAKLLEGS